MFDQSETILSGSNKQILLTFVKGFKSFKTKTKSQNITKYIEYECNHELTFL